MGSNAIGCPDIAASVMRASFPVSLFNCLSGNGVDVTKAVSVQHLCHRAAVLGREECSFGNLVVAPGEESSNANLFPATAPAGAGGNQAGVL